MKFIMKFFWVNVQDVQELNNPEQILSTWVKHLYGLVNQLNKTKTQMTGMSPSEAIELKKVPPVESYPLEDKLLEHGLYHYLLQPGEEHEDQRCRAMDRIWSKATYRLREVLEGIRTKTPRTKPPRHKPPDKNPLAKNPPCQNPPRQKPPRENL